jgi:hypothetical protein
MMLSVYVVGAARCQLLSTVARSARCTTFYLARAIRDSIFIYQDKQEAQLLSTSTNSKMLRIYLEIAARSSNLPSADTMMQTMSMSDAT